MVPETLAIGPDTAYIRSYDVLWHTMCYDVVICYDDTICSGIVRRFETFWSMMCCGASVGVATTFLSPMHDFYLHYLCFQHRF